jgi:hypothetical protein
MYSRVEIEFDQLGSKYLEDKTGTSYILVQHRGHRTMQVDASCIKSKENKTKASDVDHNIKTGYLASGECV